MIIFLKNLHILFRYKTMFLFPADSVTQSLWRIKRTPDNPKTENLPHVAKWGMKSCQQKTNTGLTFELLPDIFYLKSNTAASNLIMVPRHNAV